MESNSNPNESEQASKPKISFKNVKKRPLRTKIEDPEDNDSEEEKWSKLEEIKFTKSLNKRTNKGINAEDLLNINHKEQAARDKAEQVGGLLDLANTFSVETNRRDEDQDMLKFIEEQLSRKKGLVKQDSNETKQEVIDPDELVFNKLREDLLQDEQKKNEEMLSSQMLSGIPEVDLGLDEKIRNIEATEEAKLELLDKKLKIRSSSKNPTLVPTNVAANYVQHNRFNVDNSNQMGHNNKKAKINYKPVTTLVKEPVVVVGDDPAQGYFRASVGQNKGKLKFPGKEKATDDYHFEKFKKQFRK